MKNNRIDYSSYYWKNYREDDFDDYDREDRGEGYRRYYSDEDNAATGERDVSDWTPEYAPKGKKPLRMKKGGRIKKKVPFKRTFIVICAILLCFFVTILVADSLTGGYVLDELQTILTNESRVNNVYYAVECRTFQDIDSARVYANTLRARGGAGYVVNDNGYRVLAEMYSSKSDAESIARSLKLDGEDARVYSVEIKDVDYSKFPSSTRNVVKNTLKYIDDVYMELYTIGLDLANKRIDESMAKSRIIGLYKKMNNISVEFNANCDNETNDINIIKVKVQLKSVEGVLENLGGDIVERPSLIADIRYTSCLIVVSHAMLTQDLSLK
ncbi:MAG: SPOR domain-containing protein [Clostridia bacterium]|jgi:hypothetical protein|nr:SPOR domain-containing protein [Clostridia bacterium]MCX4366516.1 SPOR domain-containing protein [Clostridia bacterium]